MVLPGDTSPYGKLTNQIERYPPVRLLRPYSMLTISETHSSTWESKGLNRTAYKKTCSLLKGLAYVMIGCGHMMSLSFDKYVYVCLHILHVINMKYIPIFLRVCIFVYICPSYTIRAQYAYIYIYITCCHIQSWIISVASLQFQCFNPQISSARKQTLKPKQKIASTLASPKDSLFQHQRSGSTPKEKSKKSRWICSKYPERMNEYHEFCHSFTLRVSKSQEDALISFKHHRIFVKEGEKWLVSVIYQTTNKAWQHIANESFPPLAESRCHQPKQGPTRPFARHPRSESELRRFSQSRLRLTINFTGFAII